MIGPVTGASGVESVAATDQILADMGSEAFLQLLVAQLRYQNPMEPLDGAAMLEQTAQFTSVETLHQLADAQRQLTTLTQVGMAIDLTGKEVTAQSTTGHMVTGIVRGTSFTADGPVLSVDGIDIPLANVVTVAEPSG